MAKLEDILNSLKIDLKGFEPNKVDHNISSPTNQIIPKNTDSDNVAEKKIMGHKRRSWLNVNGDAVEE